MEERYHTIVSASDPGDEQKNVGAGKGRLEFGSPRYPIESHRVSSRVSENTADEMMHGPCPRPLSTVHSDLLDPGGVEVVTVALIRDRLEIGIRDLPEDAPGSANLKLLGSNQSEIQLANHHHPSMIS